MNRFGHLCDHGGLKTTTKTTIRFRDTKNLIDQLHRHEGPCEYYLHMHIPPLTKIKLYNSIDTDTMRHLIILNYNNVSTYLIITSSWSLCSRAWSSAISGIFCNKVHNILTPSNSFSLPPRVWGSTSCSIRVRSSGGFIFFINDNDGHSSLRSSCTCWSSHIPRTPCIFCSTPRTSPSWWFWQSSWWKERIRWGRLCRPSRGWWCKWGFRLCIKSCPFARSVVMPLAILGIQGRNSRYCIKSLWRRDKDVDTTAYPKGPLNRVNDWCIKVWVWGHSLGLGSVKREDIESITLNKDKAGDQLVLRISMQILPLSEIWYPFRRWKNRAT